MFESLRPDVTDEGWNTWPTQAASHALAQQAQLRVALQKCLDDALLTSPREVAALQLASEIRRLIEDAARNGDDGALRENLTYALSRVDWLQLAQAQIATPDSDEAHHTRLVAMAPWARARSPMWSDCRHLHGDLSLDQRVQIDRCRAGIDRDNEAVSNRGVLSIAPALPPAQRGKHGQRAAARECSGRKPTTVRLNRAAPTRLWPDLPRKLDTLLCVVVASREPVDALAEGLCALTLPLDVPS
jgi:hypothetical protein